MSGLRVRLTLGYAGAMLLVLAAYAASIYTFVSGSASESLDQRVRGDFWFAAATVDQQPDGTITWTDGGEATGSEEVLWLQVWSPSGLLLYQNSEAFRLPVPESRALAIQSDGGITRARSGLVPMRVLSRHGQISGVSVVIQVARSELPMRQDLRDILLILVLGLPVGVAIAGFGGYVLARRALVPVQRMAERARSITAERLHDRLPVDNPTDELGQLASVFNETLARLEASFEQMRRFTADVSHELRTPLTAIRSVGEVGLRERRSEEAYRGIIGSMLEEVDRLTGLVDQLLTLSRAETGQARLSLEAIDLLDLARNVVSHLSVLAEEKQQSIDIVGTDAPRCAGDRRVLRQALINLLDNAIKYTPAGGRITIRASESPDRAVLDVTDTGPGIGGEHREQVFERFYRDHRVGADVKGAGLGLAIAKWAVEVNGGQLSLEPGNGTGCTFRMTLPLAGDHDARAARTSV